jgi:hypothetical protein
LIGTECASLTRDLLRDLIDQFKVTCGYLTGMDVGNWSTRTTSALNARIIRARSSELPFDMMATKG